MTTIYRQGDVLIIATTPQKLTIKNSKPIPRESGRVVLAHGEVTGHAHAIASPRAALHMLDERSLDRLLRITGQKVVQLIHEEHATIALPPGDYIVRRQREYHPEELRTVAD